MNKIIIPALSFANKRVADFFNRHRVSLAKAIMRGDERVFRDLFHAEGVYSHSITNVNVALRKALGISDMGELCVDHNQVCDEGIIYGLNVMFHPPTTYMDGVAQLLTWYLGLYTGSTAPAHDDTGANVAARLTENTSTTEGYTGTRQALVTVLANTTTISNLASMAAFPIVTASSVVMKGGLLISTSTRGDTAGKLFSDAAFSAPRTLFNSETFNLGWQLTLSN